MDISAVSRRDLLAGAAAATGLAAGPAAGPASAQGAAPARPNILFIMADDLGYADVGCYGQRDFETPHIDRIAREGARLTQGYANSCVCSPTRIGLITGRYQYRLRAGLEEPINSRMAKGSDTLGLPPNHPTLPSLLRGAGYGTTLVGKWHMGFLPHFGPLRSGYDQFFGIMSGGVDYFTHKDRAPGEGGADGLVEGETPIERHGYLTELLGERAVQAVDGYAREGRPFFLSLHFTAPHWPWEGPHDEEVSRRLRSLLDWDGGSRKTYAAMVRSMDDAIGRVLRTLDERGLARDTIVVFTSDNGGERFSDVWPFSGKKGELLEGGLRVPMVARWPARIPAGATGEQVMASMDWTPTLLAAAGAVPAPSHPPDGEDLLPVLVGEAQPRPRKLFWRFKAHGQRAVRDGDWKYLRIDGNEFLFDLAEDPRERANLRRRRQDVFDRLKGEWDAWNATMLPELPEAYSDSADGSLLPDRYGIRRTGGRD